MNNDNIFYELREQNADNSNNPSRVNGDFTTKLQKPISLEYGDQLLLNKAVLDTRSLSSGKVLLENETNFEVFFTPYQRDIDNKGKYNDEARTIPKSTSNTNSFYFPLIPYKGGQDVYELTDYRLDSDQGKFPEDKGWTITIEYINLEGNRVVSHFPSIIEYWKDSIGLEEDRWATGPISILALNPNNETDINKIFINRTSPDLMSKFKITDAYGVGKNLGNTSSHYSHMELGVVATLPAGNYTPTDFSQRLTRQFNQNGNLLISEKFSQQSGGSNNNLLSSSIGDALTNYHPENPMMDNLGGQYFYFENTSNASWVGTNQFQVGFDEEINKFQIEYSHFPLYKPTTGEQIIEYVSVSSNIEVRNSYGGVILKAVKSIDNITGEELNIWSNVMGFDLHNICPATLNRQNGGLNATVPYYKKLQYGKEITGGEIGIDVAVLKGDFKYPATLPPSVPTIISGTIPIFADNDFSTININFGYFIVQIQGISTDMITYDDIKNSMMAVISRFYTTDNYTFGSPEDAIIYTHRGATQYLNSFRVRILDSNYNLAGELGDDSTLFLQHRKAQMPLDMIEMKQEKK